MSATCERTCHTGAYYRQSSKIMMYNVILVDVGSIMMENYAKLEKVMTCNSFISGNGVQIQQDVPSTLQTIIDIFLDEPAVDKRANSSFFTNYCR